MALNFPSSPAVDETYALGDRYWKYNGSGWVLTPDKVGYTGSQGVGYTGSQGASGYDGSIGSLGYTGSVGAGYNGSTGYTGSQGGLGYTGSKGDVGYNGSASTVAGPIGYTGSQGDTGYTGSASTVVGYTGSQGATGTTGYTGSASTAAGYTGSQGATGGTGYTGSRGDTGTTGYNGSQGATGSTGYTGSQGATGTTGYTGSAGTTYTTASDVQLNSLGLGTAASATTGELRATNNITAYYSDERLKNKLGNIENALDKVKSLSGFYYEANETAQALGYKVRREVGVSAQEVQAVLPEIVTGAPIDEKYLTIWYERLAPLLIEAIKELSSEVDRLKNK
jgi:hypothetical protein